MVPGEPCDEDDVETDGGDDMTPSPPDYRSWTPLNGHHQGQPVMRRMVSMKRVAADAVDGGKAVKKVKVGGGVAGRDHALMHSRRDGSLVADNSGHYI